MAFGNANSVRRLCPELQRPITENFERHQLRKLITQLVLWLLCGHKKSSIKVSVRGVDVFASSISLFSNFMPVLRPFLNQLILASCQEVAINFMAIFFIVKGNFPLWNWKDDV